MDEERLAAIEADATIRDRISTQQSYAENVAIMQGTRSGGTSIGNADRRVLAAVPSLVAAVRGERARADAAEAVLEDVRTKMRKLDWAAARLALGSPAGTETTR